MNSSQFLWSDVFLFHGLILMQRQAETRGNFIISVSTTKNKKKTSLYSNTVKNLVSNNEFLEISRRDENWQIYSVVSIVFKLALMKIAWSDKIFQVYLKIRFLIEFYKEKFRWGFFIILRNSIQFNGIKLQSL